ncbi:MAG: hypothetical protein OXI60_06120 [Acidiferrobacterales bacterium]|nr:hypothetical protein [Acidiferrobacterales bacterium]
MNEVKVGVPAAVIDGTAMTYYKTAADSALGSKLLANSSPKSMAMIGAGAMAPHLIRAHCAVHTTIDTVTIWNRTFSRAQTLADSMNIDSVEIEAGAIAKSDVRGDLYELCCGSVRGRNSTQDVTLFKNGSGGHLDLMTARYIYDKFR